MWSGPGLLWARQADPWEEAPWGTALRHLPSTPHPGALPGLDFSVPVPLLCRGAGKCHTSKLLGPGCQSPFQPCSQCDISHKRKPSGCKGWYQDSVSPVLVLALLFWTPPSDSDQLPPLPIPPTAQDPAHGPQVPIIPWEQASFSVACADVPGSPAHCSDLNLPHSSLHTVLEMPELSWFSQNTASREGLDVLSLCPGPFPGPLTPLRAVPASHLPAGLPPCVPLPKECPCPTPGPSNLLPS